MKRILYLAPEIPALSATFVYEEFLGLEKRGHFICPVSVRTPEKVASDQPDISKRTQVLYDSNPLIVALSGLLIFLFGGNNLKKSLCWLYNDMKQGGFFSPSSLKLVFQFLAAAKLVKIARANNCSHMHVHFAHTPSQIAMYATAMSDIPFTVMAHANDLFQRGSALKVKAARSKKFLTISQHNIQFLIDQGVDKNHLDIVRCGVSFDTKRRAAPSFEGKTVKLGTLGRLVEKKGVDVLIKAMALLKRRGAKVELSIAGDGPLEDELKALQQEQDVLDVVTFEGRLNHSQVSGWMDTIDVFILACKVDSNGDMDGIPVVLMEAMSQSIPVISTSLSGIAELITHEQTGLLATPGDEVTLADQIERMITDTPLRSEIAERAVDHVENEFSLQRNLDRLEQYF